MPFGLHRYGPLLRTPGARRLLSSTFGCRVGQFGNGVALLLAVHAASGSFGIAGSATGLASGGLAVSRIVQGRLLDRRGAVPVLLISAVLFVAACTALIAVLATGGATAPTLMLSAALGCTLPAADTVARMTWASLAPDPHERTRAYALDTMSAELAAIIGPATAGIVATAVSPTLALAGTAALVGAGTVAIACSEVVRQAGVDQEERAPVGGFVRLLLMPAAMMLGLGLMVGAVDVSVPAFAVDEGSPGATGPLYAALALGSACGGLWYGARLWRARAMTRLVVAFALVSVCCMLLPLASSTLALGVALLLLGLPIPAVLTTLYLLTDQTFPPGRLGEAFASITSALVAGIALGSALGGWTAAGAGPRASFALAAGLSFTGLAAAAWSARRRPAGTV